MKLSWKWILFALLIAVQWYIMYTWINSAQEIIKKGTYMKIPLLFANQIYENNGTTNMYINPDPGYIYSKDSARYTTNQTLWLHYTCDENNNCTYHSVSESNDQDMHALKVHVQYVHPVFEPDSTKKYSAQLNYSFQHMNIPGSISNEAREKYNLATQDSTKKIYVGLYAWKGEVVTDAVWVNNEKIK